MGSRNTGKRPDSREEGESASTRLLRPRGMCYRCHFPAATSCVCPCPSSGTQESKIRVPTTPMSQEQASTSIPQIVHRKKLFSGGSPTVKSRNISPVSRRQLFKEKYIGHSCVSPVRPVIGAVSAVLQTGSVQADPGVSVASQSSQVVEDLAIPSTSAEPAPSTASIKKKKKKLKLSGRHICRVCSKMFGSPGKLSQHMFSHTGEKPFECEKCMKAFSSKFKLVRHLLIHSDERQYRCTMCERTFHRKDHLKNHFKVHSPVKKTYRCDKVGCLKVYSSQLSYRKHAAVHAAEDGDLDCKMCGRRFITKDEIVYHLKVHAGSRTVKNPSDKKYRCDFCERRFFTRKDVRRHLVVHTGKRDFLCQFCPQRFGRKDHLVRHIKKSHSNVSVAAVRGTVPKGKRIRIVPAVEEGASVSCVPSTSTGKQKIIIRTLARPKGTIELQTNVESCQEIPVSTSQEQDTAPLMVVIGDNSFPVDTKPSKEELSVAQLKVEELMSQGEDSSTYHVHHVKIEDCSLIPDLQPIIYTQPPPYPEHLTVTTVTVPVDQVDGSIKPEAPLASLSVGMDMNQFMTGLLVSADTVSESVSLSNQEQDHRSSAATETEPTPGISDAEATEFLAHFSNDDEIMQLMELSLPATSTSTSAATVSEIDSSGSHSAPLPRFNQAFQQQPP